MAQIGAGGISAFGGGAGQGEIVQWPGIYYGAVSNNADPKKQNRCLLRIPQILGSAVTTWAVSLTPLQNPPKVGTLIAAMFVGGDLDYPCYLVVNPQIVVENTDANVKPVGTVSKAGTSTKLAAADHVHGSIETNAAHIQPVASGATASAGTSANIAAADHVHAANVQGLGTGGTNEISSSLVSGGDTAALIDMFSRLAAGQSEIDLTATNVNLNSATVTITGTGVLNVNGSAVSTFTGGITSQNLTTIGDVSVQGTDLFVGNGTTANVNLNPKMGTPVNYPLGHISTTPTSAEFNAVVDTVNNLIGEMQNRNMVN